MLGRLLPHSSPVFRPQGLCSAWALPAWACCSSSAQQGPRPGGALTVPDRACRKLYQHVPCPTTMLYSPLPACAQAALEPHPQTLDPSSTHALGACSEGVRDITPSHFAGHSFYPSPCTVLQKPYSRRTLTALSKCRFHLACSGHLWTMSSGTGSFCKPCQPSTTWPPAASSTMTACWPCLKLPAAADLLQHCRRAL